MTKTGQKLDIFLEQKTCPNYQNALLVGMY